MIRNSSLRNRKAFGMIRSPLLLAAVVTMSSFSAASLSAQSPQLYEVRSYLLGEKSDVAAIDQYLAEALLPALERQGIGPVGAFTNSQNDETGSPRIVVVIPYTSATQIVAVKQALQSDPQYQSAAKAYLDRGPENPPYSRIQSELLSAMDCWKQLKVPDGLLDNSDRVYELRLYESANERLGNLKVDMFNGGEVPIFLDCGIQPIFIGQGLLGPQTPNLTYLTAYPNEQARLEAWNAFRKHPDWNVLKKVAKYQGTVSKIDKFVLVARPYSQM
jgi:hypothetical protein